MKKHFTIAILLLTGILNTIAGQGLSNRGKEFWVAYGHHQFFEPGQSNGQEMVLYLSAEQPATVTVSINGTTWTRTYNIAANTVIATDFIPKAGANDARLYSLPVSFGGNNSEGVFNKGIHIESNVPIVAYAHIFGSASSGSTMLMPTETWGYNYVSVNFTQSYGNNCFSWVNVISNNDNTRVKITPSVPSRGGRVAGTPFEVTLNKGEVYQLLGAIQSGSNGYDMTGTTIQSIANAQGQCFPIATISGSSRTLMASGCSGGGGDNFLQQVFPSQAWGKRYLTAPTSSSGSASVAMNNYFRVVVKDPSTIVRRNGVVLTGLISNTYYQFSSTTADYITADKPILVSQYMPSSGCLGSGLGDPEMFYISPIEQAIKSVGFYRNTRENITINYLTLIIPTAGVASLRIDNSNVFDYSYPHPNLTGYTVVVKRWNAAQAQARATSDSAFTAITYGLGSVESYGYNAGTLINNLNVIGEIRNEYNDSTSTNAYTCKNTPFIPTVLIAYKPTKMVWRFSQVNGITPNADLTDLNPTLIDSQLVSGAWYFRYRLNQSYAFADTGTYEIPILTTHPSIENCSNTEEVKISIIVRTSPATNFTFSTSPTDTLLYTGCRLDSVYFKGNSATVGAGLPVNRFRWSFSSNPNDTAVVQNPVKLFTAPGTYNVKFQGITVEGCVGDTTKTLTIYAPPTADFTTTPLSACQPATITANTVAAYGGTAPIKTWYWDFGNGQTSSNTTAAAAATNYPNLGTYTIKHVAKISDLCISDTVTKTIRVYAKPQVNFTYPAGCLQSNGLAQFNDATVVADSQAVTYLWNFGDAGNATPANPDTSSLKNPTHIYSSYGTYNVKLTVTTVNGCTKDTTIAITFSLRPTFVYAPISSVCVNRTGAVSVATASVTNNVPGAGIYRGPGTDAAGNFNPSVAGVGTHTIWYVYQTTGGCRDSISQTIKVFAKPVADFSVSAATICVGDTTTITDNSSVLDATIRDWNWNLGDGTNVTYQNGNPFTKFYAASGSYTVRLFVVSDSSCVSDTVTKTVTVRPLPVASFTLPSSVCMPAGLAQFTNTSGITGGGPLVYSWNFGDGSTPDSSVSPLHIYSASGPYNITLTVRSEAGCVSDTTKTLATFYDQPNASFSINTDVLCQGTTNIFTDRSTAPNSQITIRNWTFGDGTRSSFTNPAKRYISPGTYTVSLNVENAQGCKSDTFSRTVTVYLQPLVNAGRSFIVPEGTTVQFEGIANDTNTVNFLWTPGFELSNDTILRPRLIARSSQTYFLTATGDGNCTATDSLTVKILKLIQIPNVFSPNGDGINDTWVITNLADYPGATIEIYDRYGHMLMRKTGYDRPWDGTLNGSPLPIGTYYYIIDPRNGFKQITGPVTILR